MAPVATQRQRSVRHRRVLLASVSPRRRAILGALGVRFEAVEVDVDERPRPGEEPEQLAVRLAVAKAATAARRDPPAIAVGADTVVALGAEALGKPQSPDDAFLMLQRLRGGPHRVITAVAAARSSPDRAGEPELWSRVATARVWMRPYTDDEIRAYVGSGDPFDKAGAYAIQSLTFRPVERVEGCFLTVVGLPLPELRDVLADAGAPAPPITAAALATVCPSCADQGALLAQTQANEERRSRRPMGR